MYLHYLRKKLGGKRGGGGGGGQGLIIILMTKIVDQKEGCDQQVSIHL